MDRATGVAHRTQRNYALPLSQRPRPRRQRFAAGRQRGIILSTEETRRQNLYFPAEMLRELQQEAKRQDRSISWLVQRAWSIARQQLQRVPSTNDFDDNDVGR